MLQLTYIHCTHCAAGNVYDAIYDVAAFARAGHKQDSSPAEEVLADFAALGLTVDDLYATLALMDARQCMELLQEHGTLCVHA